MQQRCAHRDVPHHLFSMHALKACNKHYPFSLWWSAEKITEHITHLRRFSVMMISWLFSNARELHLRRRICLRGFQKGKWRTMYGCMENEAPHFSSTENSQCVHVRWRARASTRSEHFASTACFFFSSIVTQNLTEPFTRSDLYHMQRLISSSCVTSRKISFFQHLICSLCTSHFEDLISPQLHHSITHSLLEWSSNFSGVNERKIEMDCRLQGRVKDTC